MKDGAKPAKQATEETARRISVVRSADLEFLLIPSPAMNRWVITDRPLRGLNYRGRPRATAPSLFAQLSCWLTPLQPTANSRRGHPPLRLLPVRESDRARNRRL